ncbi:MAG TPA: ribonuclease Z, partial [Chondromyces sp.]|nr:ribonuclease Z [Chondromyces sp.]
FQGGDSPLSVYGPPGIRSFIEVSLQVSGTRLQYPLEIVEIEEGIVFEDEQMKVQTRLLDHGISSYGYRITEKDKPGELLAEKLIAEGIKPGPVYKEIKKGGPVLLEDGRVIEGADFIGAPQKGKIISILGDTRPCEAAVALALGADLLVHEATLAAGNEEMASEHFHSTTTQAANIAKQAEVKALCLTHISSRYTLEEATDLQREAQTVFSKTYVARDFFEFKIG